MLVTGFIAPLLAKSGRAVLEKYSWRLARMVDKQLSSVVVRCITAIIHNDADKYQSAEAGTITGCQDAASSRLGRSCPMGEFDMGCHRPNSGLDYSSFHTINDQNCHIGYHLSC